MNLASRIYPVVQPLLRAVRRSRWVIRRIFGVRIPANTQVQFDPVTVLLAKTLPELIASRPAGQPLRLLEMGVGEGALVTLSIADWNSGRGDGVFALELEGVDCSASRVESSRRVAEYNQVRTKFWVSNLFEAVLDDNQYDFVFFNPPYVPTRTGHALKLTERLGVDGDQMWDGGDDGTETLRQFLTDAKRILRPDGLLVFGVQPLFVSDPTIQAAISQCGHQLSDRYARRGVPAVAYSVSPFPK